MKTLLAVAAAALFAATLNLPIGYFTFLRILVTIASVAVVVNEYEDGINLWVILFGLIAILFNPLFPVYFHDKSTWIPIDIACGILFLIKSLLPVNKPKLNE
jgi:hypothetical protein